MLEAAWRFHEEGNVAEFCPSIENRRRVYSANQKMTTLASWAALDSRGVASLYLVSDSRFTNVVTGKVHTDSGQKVYVCTNEPHLFGFCGSVAFPARAISALVKEIDRGAAFSQNDNLDVRHATVTDFLFAQFRTLLRTPVAKIYASAFNILHAAREGIGLKSIYRLWIIRWSPLHDWQVSEIQMPEYSKLLYEDGSGATALRIEDDNWQRSDVSKTSRAVFSAFCDALSVGKDPYSGGAPQLGGLFRKSGGKYFGIIYRQNTFLKGQRVAGESVPKNVEWFNETFERADPVAMTRLQKAQRQPRPWREPSTTRRLP